MPDVKVYHRDDTFDDEKKATFKVAFATEVARALSCEGFSGESVELTHEQIDVLLIAFSAEDAYLGERSILVEVSGYDYPARMDNIEARLGQIKAAVELLADRYASVTFIRISDKCWV